MAVGPEAEMDQVEHGRCAGHGFESSGVAGRGRRQVALLDRHGIQAVRRQRYARQEALAQMLEIAIGTVGGRHALVDLKDLELLPRHTLVDHERAQHQPRRPAAAQRQ